MSIHIENPSRPTGNAAAGDVLAGKTFENSTGAQTGTMPENGGMIFTPGTVNQTIPEGHHDGTGAVQGDGHLVPGNIASGVSIFGVAGTLTPQSPPTGTATVDQVLTGETFESAAEGGAATGTMPDNGQKILTPSGSGTVAIPAGYHDGTGYVAQVSVPAANVLTGTTIAGVAGTMPENGSLGTITPSTVNQTIPAGHTSGGTVAGSNALVASNIKTGINLFGVVGNVIQASGDAGAADVLSGKTFSNASGSGTGTIPTVAGGNIITPGTVAKTAIAAGQYAQAAISVAGDANLAAGNIANGISIFGVAGTVIPRKIALSSPGTSWGNGSQLTINNLGFTPQMVIAHLTNVYDNTGPNRFTVMQNTDNTIYGPSMDGHDEYKLVTFSITINSATYGSLVFTIYASGSNTGSGTLSSLFIMGE